MTMKCILSASFTVLLTTVGCSTAPPQLKPEAPKVESIEKPTVPPATPENDRQLSEEEMKALNDYLPKKTRKILEEAEEFELMAIGINSIDRKQNLVETVVANRFGRFPVLGKTKISDTELKRKLVKALYEGIVDARSSNMCFYPRHAIRATRQGKTVELVICFECLNFRGSSPDGELSGQITATPRELFNQTLVSADVQLTK